jgi:hypothetical protein
MKQRTCWTNNHIPLVKVIGPHPEAKAGADQNGHNHCPAEAARIWQRTERRHESELHAGLLSMPCPRVGL